MEIRGNLWGPLKLSGYIIWVPRISKPNYWTTTKTWDLLVALDEKLLGFTLWGPWTSALKFNGNQVNSCWDIPHINKNANLMVTLQEIFFCHILVLLIYRYVFIRPWNLCLVFSSHSGLEVGYSFSWNNLLQSISTKQDSKHTQPGSNMVYIIRIMTNNNDGLLLYVCFIVKLCCNFWDFVMFLSSF